MSPVNIDTMPKSITHLLIKLVELLGYLLGNFLNGSPMFGYWYKLSSNNTH